MFEIIHTVLIPCRDQIIIHWFYLKGWIKVWQFCTFEIDIRQWRPRPRYGKQHHKYEKRPCQRPLRYYVKEVINEFEYANTEAVFNILLENLGFLDINWNNGLNLYTITWSSMKLAFRKAGVFILQCTMVIKTTAKRASTITGKKKAIFTSASQPTMQRGSFPICNKWE